jgi:LysM repeat protein
VAGDTLAVIANRFGTTVEALMAANGISDPDRIVEGQILTIP